MKPGSASLYFPSVLAAIVLFTAGVPARAQMTPPACDRSVTLCERLNWVEQVMWTRDAGGIPHLREAAAADAHERVRERSIGALVSLGDTGAADTFLDRLGNDPSPAVRRAAAEAIGTLKLKVPLERLTGPLQKDSYPLVRAECARAIGRTGQAGGGPALLIALIQDPSPDVRALCAEALALLHVQEGMDTLRHTAARDPSPIVRYYALLGLADSAPSASLSLFKEVWENTDDPELRVEAFRGLLLAGGGGEWIDAGMADADRRIRFLAFREWITRLRVDPKARLTRNYEIVQRIEPFLSDPVRGIRDLAKAYLEKQGLKVRQSGLIYVIAD
ncbi:MAG: HEAT repeat domain-containing protein [Deltaproteobacteria bacterium]|nr:HEAT repeat domain-containing protein [Deltaproteobacteria bacterium]